MRAILCLCFRNEVTKKQEQHYTDGILRSLYLYIKHIIFHWTGCVFLTQTGSMWRFLLNQECSGKAATHTHTHGSPSLPPQHGKTVSSQTHTSPHSYILSLRYLFNYHHQVQNYFLNIVQNIAMSSPYLLNTMTMPTLNTISYKTGKMK